MVDDYPSEDYGKYLYAQTVLRIHRIIDEMDFLGEADSNFGTFLFEKLEEIEACSHLAVFEDRDAIYSTKIPKRVCMALTGELTYSDGRQVATFVDWEGGSATYVWHPDPTHPSNQPGQVIDMDDIRGPGHRKFVVAGLNIIDTLATDELAGDGLPHL